MSLFAARDDKDAARWTGPAILLIAVNCVPLIGVVLWGWSLFDIVVLYWFENVVIGAVNILKIVTCAPDQEYLKMTAKGKQLSAEQAPTGSLAHHASKLFLIPFFCFHYGLFCLVHGTFVFRLLGPGSLLEFRGPSATLQGMVSTVLGGELMLAASTLVFSHLYSYFFHFIWRGEMRRTNVGELFVAPYGRVVVLHFAILFGAFATVFLGQPMILVILLIVGKTLLDRQMHLREHRGTSGNRMDDH